MWVQVAPGYAVWANDDPTGGNLYTTPTAPTVCIATVTLTSTAATSSHFYIPMQSSVTASTIWTGGFLWPEHAPRHPQFQPRAPAVLRAREINDEAVRQQYEEEMARLDERRRNARSAAAASYEERRARFLAASARARDLLLQLCRPAERAEFLEHGFITVEGRSGTRYRIRRGNVANLEVLGPDGGVSHRLCVHPHDPSREMPPEDVMISQLLHLNDNEAELVLRANRHPALPA